MKNKMKIASMALVALMMGSIGMVTPVKAAEITTQPSTNYSTLYNSQKTISQIRQGFYPTSNPENFSPYLSYFDGLYSGTLQRTSVKFSPVYHVETKPVYQSIVRTNSIKDDNIFPLELPYTDAQEFKGTMQRTSVSWNPIYTSQSQYFTKAKTYYNLPRPDNTLVATTYYVNENGFVGNIPLSNVQFKPVYRYQTIYDATRNQYMERVIVTYDAYATYSGSVTKQLVKYYEGRASYQGIASKQVFDGYNGTAYYTGTVYSTYSNYPTYPITPVLY